MTEVAENIDPLAVADGAADGGENPEDLGNEAQEAMNEAMNNAGGGGGERSVFLFSALAVFFGPLINAISGWIPRIRNRNANNNDDDDNTGAVQQLAENGPNNDDVQQAVGRAVRRQISPEER